MKVSLYVKDLVPPQPGYKPVTIDELVDIDTSSLEEIIVINSLDYYENTVELLQMLASKLQYGAKLILENLNINAVLRAYRYNEIDAAGLNKLLYGGRQSVVSNIDIVNILDSIGFNVLKHSLNHFKYTYTIVAERPGP